MLKYFCINYGDQRAFRFDVVFNVLASSFSFLIPMGLRSLSNILNLSVAYGDRLYTSASAERVKK